MPHPVAIVAFILVFPGVGCFTQLYRSTSGLLAHGSCLRASSGIHGAESMGNIIIRRLRTDDIVEFAAAVTVRTVAFMEEHELHGPKATRENFDEKVCVRTRL